MPFDIRQGSQPMFQSYSLFGAKVTPTTLGELLCVIEQHANSRQHCVILSQNLHGMRVREQSSAFLQLEARPTTYVHIDGMPLVGLCRIAGIHAKRHHRVTWADLIWKLLERANENRWRIYFLGGTEETQHKALEKIKARYPTLTTSGHHGFFDATSGSSAAAAIVQQIEAFAPHLLLVGMGMGRQEKWIADHLDDMPPMCISVIGACLEYVAGTVSTPPRWMGRWGLEWLCRLLENPRRFWKRYLIEPWIVLGQAVRYEYRNRRARRSA